MSGIGRGLLLLSDNNCPDCYTSLELLEDSRPFFNHTVWGCEKCNSVFDERESTGCFDNGGPVKRYGETLVEYKKEIADRPQVEIRRERLMLAQELGRLREKFQDAQKAYQDGQVKFEAKIRELWTRCEHPNRKQSEFCEDCGHRKSAR